MKNYLTKKRGLWLEFSLIVAIIAIGFFVFQMTTNFKTNRGISANTDTPTADQSEKVVRPSDTKDISIVQETATQSEIPFDLLYPKTIHPEVNKTILTYIDDLKNNYISNMKNTQITGGATGNLTTTFETFSYHGDYTSMILTAVKSVPNGSDTSTIQTFFMNNTTGHILQLSELFKKDEKTRATFNNFMQARFPKQAKVDWATFKNFAIKDGILILYFNTNQQAAALQVNLDDLYVLLKPALQQPLSKNPTPTVISRGSSSSEKRIALTFDDGPHPVVTPQILATLERYNAKATFFMIGSCVEKSPEVAREVLARGHEIGNHTWSHANLKKLTPKQIRQEFLQTEEAIMYATAQPSSVFRPPFGITSDEINQLFSVPVTLWSIDTKDWDFRSADMLLPMIQQQAHDGGIILMHDIHQSTADGLARVLEYLQSEGYSFVTASEMLEQ